VSGAVEFVDYDQVVETSAGAMAGYDLHRSRLVADLEDALREWADADDGEWTDAETDRTAEIAEKKYQNSAWVEKRTDPLN